MAGVIKDEKTESRSDRGMEKKSDYIREKNLLFEPARAIGATCASLRLISALYGLFVGSQEPLLVSFQS